ncbi:MAG TPA: Fur family transcriptional regulator [Gammaproteobacteria bacterium]
MFPQPGHDHASCIASALRTAEALCRRRGARLTAQRREVLELVWSGHAPIGAYALLERMREAGTRRPAPMTVYRALEFLQAHGLIHRIASLNAYVGCIAPGSGHGSQFLICRSCHAVGEVHDEALDAALEQVAADGGFRLDETRVELEGLCQRCQARDDAHG